MFWYVARRCWASRGITSFKNQHNSENHKSFFTTFTFCKYKATSEEARSILRKEKIFENAKEEICNKETFKNAVDTYLIQEKTLRGHVEFIYAALRRMPEFSVHKDLDVYKKLLDIFPKGKFIPTNVFQVELMHYPKHQQCAVDLLEQMEDNGVCPDSEMHDMLLTIFGNHSHPMKKFKRMLYWMPKFKNASPYVLPNKIPSDEMELAVLALKRMSPDILNKVTIFHITAEDDPSKQLENNWVASAQSPDQQRLISKHLQEEPIYVEGGFYIWLRDRTVTYFILRADPKPEHMEQNKIPDFDAEEDLDFENWTTYFSEPSTIQEIPNIHQQEDSTILGLCVPKVPIKESLVAWLKCLQESNPGLSNIPVIFTLRSPANQLQIIEEEHTASDIKPQKLS